MTPRARLRRFRALQDLGCIACGHNGVWHVPCDIHHITEGHDRLGDEYTIPLCAFHHRGIAENVWDKLRGPSLARSKRDFVNEYGTERELLAETNRLIKAGPEGSASGS